MALSAASIPSGRGVFVETAFGNVSDRRVQFFANKGRFGGGVQEDLPLRHVTAVRVESPRHVIWAALFAIGGLGTFASGEAVAVLAGVCMLALAAFFLWASPKVVINAAGGDLRKSSGWPWVKNEADRFATAVREELFKTV